MSSLNDLDLVRDYYDHGWDAQWDDMKKYGPMARHIRRNIKELIRPLQFDTVLDVGCGQGSFLVELQQEFPHIQIRGTDISPSAVRLVQERVPQGEFFVLDASQEHLDQQFDLIVCSEVLEHIPDDVSALRHIAQMTRKYLVISTIQGRMRKIEPEAWGHVRNYARGELVRKVQQSGLEVVKVIEWGFPFYSPIYRNVIDFAGTRGTTGEFGGGRRLLSSLLYNLFMLNSSKRGDEIFVLAQRKASSQKAYSS
jgi:2-polyprenyl-3-methyl-5-hydroxy-6-metoxy-1,4-benzoquinol methylase